MLPLLGAVEEEESQVEKVERDRHQGVTLQFVPQLLHLGCVANALHHHERLVGSEWGAEAEGFAQQRGALHPVQIEKIDFLIESLDDFIQARSVPKVHLTLGGLQVELRNGGIANTQAVAGLYKVDQAEKEPLHLQRLAATGWMRG